jgi:hypothetical protein
MPASSQPAAVYPFGRTRQITWNRVCISWKGSSSRRAATAFMPRLRVSIEHRPVCLPGEIRPVQSYRCLRVPSDQDDARRNGRISLRRTCSGALTARSARGLLRIRPSSARSLIASLIVKTLTPAACQFACRDREIAEALNLMITEARAAARGPRRRPRPDTSAGCVMLAQIWHGEV